MNRGKVLDYMGMMINYHNKGKLNFSMQEFISKLIDELPYDMDGIAKTPAANHLFNLNDNKKKLTEEKHIYFIM